MSETTQAFASSGGEGRFHAPRSIFVSDTEVEIPRAINHGHVYKIIGNKQLSREAKKGLLLALAVGSFALKIPDLDKEKLFSPDQEPLSDLITFADFVKVEARGSTEMQVMLEILDETVEPFADVSPIGEAQHIAEIEPQHGNLTDTVVLASKLWTLDHMGEPDDMPDAFIAAKSGHKKIVAVRMRKLGGFSCKTQERY